MMLSQHAMQLTLPIKEPTEAQSNGREGGDLSGSLA